MTPLPKHIESPILFDSNGVKNLVAFQYGKCFHWILDDGLWMRRELSDAERDSFYHHHKGKMLHRVA